MLRNALQVLAVAALFAAFTASSASADVVAAPVGLDVLIDTPAEVQTEDLLFSNFFHASAVTDPANITVSNYTDGDGNYGIRFDGPFGNVTQDNAISFDVTVLDGGPGIADVHIFGQPIVIDEDASSTGGAVFTDITDQVLARLVVFDNGEEFQYTDAADFEECYETMTVDIDLTNIGFTNWSDFRVTFSRCEIPTPAALPAGLAMLGLAAVRRRRNG